MKENRDLYKFEKTQMVILGLLIPIAIALWSLYFLAVHGKSVFPGRSEYIWFHGYQAYFVACLWLGTSIVLFGHNYLRFKWLKKRRSANAYLYVGFTLIAVGLLSSILFVVIGKT